MALALAGVAGPRMARAQSGHASSAASTEAWRLIQPPQSSLVYARDGSLLGEIGRQWRTSVALKSLPKYVPQAFVAVEDHRFFQHEGVDVVGIAGAIKDNILGKHRGASTITQQLIGNMHPDLIDRTDRSLGRKLREQAAAIEMERHYTKDQILEAYLNQLDLGHGWFGVEAAARHYFGKNAAKLTLAEAATLASIPKGPAIYDPIKHPDRVLTRRNIALALMAEQGFITQAAADAAARTPVTTAAGNGTSAPAAYVLDAVRRQAEHDGVPVSNGGFRILTTIDPLMQRSAVDALLAETTRIESTKGYKHPTMAKRPKGSTDYLQGAVVALEARTGDVLALVGGRDYVASPFNRALLAQRQPGSSIKPIVYAAAIADSIPPNEIIPDTALSIPLADGTVYSPKNSDGQFLGPITMHMALARSRNPVSVQLWERVGYDSIAALAKRMGIATPIAPYPSSAIGASVVRPLDYVAAFTAFADSGMVVEPRLIQRVDDQQGRPVLQPPASTPRPAMDPKVAFIVRSMMRDVVERGTATAVRQYVPASIPVAGKTGTTNDNTDVWFIGVTPEIVAGVWLGFDRPKTITPGAVGGTYAAPIWGKMVGRWYAGRQAGSWEPPSDLVPIELDRDTGALSSAATPANRRYVEYFLAGTEPGGHHFNPLRVLPAGPIPF